MKRNILIVAGETSGDMHAADLVRQLKKLYPDASFFGMGGKRMKEVGVELVETIENLSIIGVSEVFAKYSHIQNAMRRLLAKSETTKPDLAILVDYPGFNLVLAKKLKNKGIPLAYYITPQVWAWGKFRIRLLKRYIDKAIVILKFEEKLLREYGIDATFVGNPILDRQKTKKRDKSSYGLDVKRKTLALLPGSRKSEVMRILPTMLKTVELVSKEKDIETVLLKADGVPEEIYRNIVKDTDIKINEIKNDTYGCLSVSDFVFTASGTATLETAIMERPMLITYKTSLLTMIFFRIFSRTPYIGLVNIIAGKEVVPEILQYDAKPKVLARTIVAFLESKSKIERQLTEIKKVKESLGTPGAAMRAAELIGKRFLN